ncbi:MAG: Lrp/AsnC family transcriptional regulator [Candidatus Diapherotrites archaeon]
MELSNLELRIIRYGLENGLLESEREIAKKLRISPSTFSFKMRKLEDKGIITTYRYRIDFTKLGFTKIAWIRFRPEYGKHSMEEYMQKILENPQVHVCAFTSGSKNFAIKVYAKSIQEIKEITKKIGKEHNANKNIETIIITKQLKAHNLKISEQKSQIKFDEKHYEILSKKMQNPKQSIIEIAKELNLHRNTITKKWKEMIDNKIILKKTPIINPEFYRQIGIHCMAMHIFTPKKGMLDKLSQQLLEMKEVHELNETKDKKLLAIIRTNDLGSYFKITSEFLSKKKISKCIQKSLFNIIITSDSRRPTYLKDLKKSKV